MLNLNLMREAAALAGYTIDASTGQDVTNKTRAQRRLNAVKTDVISRYAGKWASNYREGWLPISALYNTGTADFTNGSRTVTGHSTVWTTDMKGQKILGADGAYYKIASVASSTSLVMTQPFQGTSITLHTYEIWQDEYRLYPEVLTIGGFVDYNLQQVMGEAWPKDMKASFPLPADQQDPNLFTVLSREGMTASYSTGTITGSANSNSLTGSGTSWLANIEPGFEITIGTTIYHVKRVNSDTDLELYQQLTAAISGMSYTAKGKNSMIVRFRKPSTQRIVHYWYWAKDYPFVNDNDEDWIAETYPRVLIDGMAYFDYIDKNDVARAFNSRQVYEDSIKNMKVAVDGAYTGVRTLGYNFPPEARG